MAGIRKLRTTIFLHTCERIGTTEIGRISEGCLGEATFGIGCITACFQGVGTRPDIMLKFMICARGLLKIGAPNLRNQNGKPSEPGEVLLSLLRKQKTLASVTYSLLSLTVDLDNGII